MLNKFKLIRGKDVAHEVYVRQQIENGLELARRGKFAGDEELKEASKKWDVQVEIEVN